MYTHIYSYCFSVYNIVKYSLYFLFDNQYQLNKHSRCAYVDVIYRRKGTYLLYIYIVYIQNTYAYSYYNPRQSKNVLLKVHVWY